ncbi:MAG: molybdopterin-dependent oxidoreductase [Deltaproteobacteria bacterium]|nr:molybdopterin-dependent oxidoreductase [Deltaproteobacteria bacterium]
MLTSAKPSICRICKENCGILVLDDGQKIKITGNPEHPVSKGFICFRGKNFGRVHYSSDRLNQPLLKKGVDWVRISFEEALEILASKLQSCKEKYGPQSVVFYKGESLKHQEVTEYMRHLSYGFGTPNYISVGSICHFALAAGHGLTCGGIPMPDFERINIAIIWGANPAVSSVRMFSSLRKAVRKGIKLIVIDPSHTQTAKSANYHLPIIPGSDGFLALAFIKYAFGKAGIIPQSSTSYGWNELKSMIDDFSYEYLLEKTGIREPDFYKISSMIFENLPGWIFAGAGLEFQPSGVQVIRSIASLQSILDPLNRPSPLAVKLKPLPGMDTCTDMPDPIGTKEAPFYTSKRKEGQGMYLTRAILDNNPYPVKAMLIAGGNPALTFPASHLHAKAFRKLDFLAVFDLFMTPTAQMADLIFPAADFLENMELHDYGQIGKPYLGLIQPVISEGKGWPAWKLIFELARKLEIEQLFPWQDNKDALRYRLSGSGIDFDDFNNSPSSVMPYQPKKDDKGTWNTPDGKVHYYSRVLEKKGYPGLPGPSSFTLPFGIDEKFPFWLSTGDRVSSFQHSQFRNIPEYRSGVHRPLLDIHSDAADLLGIKDGDRAVLSTKYGSLTIRIKLSNDIRKDCLRMTHGWEEANANELTGLKYFDPVSGFPWLRALPAAIEKKGG